MKDLIPGLFSFDGRMGRAEFWLLLVGVSIASSVSLMVASMIVITIVGADMAPSLGPLYTLARALMQVLILWPVLAILTKRGHDRNRPAVLSIGLWLTLNAAWLGAAFAPPAALVGGVILLYFLVDYGLIPGTQGANRFDSRKPKAPSANALKAAALFD